MDREILEAADRAKIVSNGTNNSDMAVMAAQNLVQRLRGERPAHLVNPEVWDRRRI